MAPRKSLKTQDATPLRRSKATSDPNEAQEEYLAAFLCACVLGYTGVYVTRYTNSGAIKLKLYIDGNQYEDILETNEEWGPLFDDYATQAGVRGHYLAVVKRIHAARAERAAEAAEGTAEGESTAPPTPKALRGR